MPNNDGSAGAGRDGSRLLEHELKTWPEYFSEVESGAKTFEVRRDDRYFLAGDVLVLREWHPDTGYTGRSLRRVVSYILTTFAGIEAGYVCMALAVPDPLASDTEQGEDYDPDEAFSHAPTCDRWEQRGIKAYRSHRKCTCGRASAPLASSSAPQGEKTNDAQPKKEK